jgi:hypothetical protein
MRFFRRLPLFTMVAGISLAVGFAVPVVFEWGEKPAARSRYPALEMAAISLLVVTPAVCALIAWLRKPVEAPQKQKLQFSLRRMFAITTLMAVVLSAARWLDVAWTSASVTAVALGTLAWSCLQDASVRSRTGALLAGLFFPFAWIVPFNEPFGSTSGLVTALPIGPAILPAELIRVYLTDGIGVDGMLPIAAVIVIAELLLGAWLAQRGGKLLVAYVLFLLVVSCLSSLAMHAMYRM